MPITNWGNYPSLSEGKLYPLFPGAPLPERPPYIARGMGRCYGDASLGPCMLDMRARRRLLDFEPETGLLCCEAGVTFEDLLIHFVPRGWFPPVTPGTKFVSLGGALAANVHGKNHHREGAISHYVEAFDLWLADGGELHCSRTCHPGIFWATLGGMGLTGTIVRVWLRLKPIESSWIRGKVIKTANLAETLDSLALFDTATYTVAWLDVLASGRHMGRSVLQIGEHASRQEVPSGKQEVAPPKARLSIPFFFPSFALNRLSIRTFNVLYYHKHLRTQREQLLPYDGFFYPLDAILNWNRIYGRRGFVQYQFVLPRAASAAGLQAMLARIRASGQGSFLTVLKLLGAGEGLMAFPMEGFTLAMDFPITSGLFPLLDELDHMVVDHGGRVYLAKDARLSPELLPRMYPQLPEFQRILKEVDPQGRLQSLLARRLAIV